MGPDKKCATCEHWHGNRECENVMGFCLRYPQRIEKSGLSVCGEWRPAQEAP